MWAATTILCRLHTCNTFDLISKVVHYKHKALLHPMCEDLKWWLVFIQKGNGTKLVHILAEHFPMFLAFWD